MNPYTSQIMQYSLPVKMWQPKQNMPMLEENDYTLDNFQHHEKEEDIVRQQDIEEDYIDLLSKSIDTGSCVRDILSRRSL